ncbi:MAG TPA: XRE family transcriptional regulator [Spirochaetia bacterium]|nr:XRE family transcriptional regulator [Spirochaetia bacterium]
MEPAEPPRIGRNIQKIRKQRHLTLGVLSEKSGVSKAMLSQIELERVNPTIATLWKIARGLAVELDSLLKGSDAQIRKFSVTRKENFVALDTAHDGLHFQVLSPLSMAEDLEIYLLTIEPGRALQSSAHAPRTEEYLTVLDGKVLVTAGDNSAELTEGDFIIYNCDVQHSIQNSAEKSALIHMIVRFQKKQWE